jgi:6-pyruvoyltetrahydropterin/6-carboxytetrahydropterin synthase
MPLTVTRRITFDATSGGRSFSYALEISVTGPLDRETGTVADFLELRDVGREVVERVIGAGSIEPATAENLVIALWRELEPRFRPAALARLRLWETPAHSVEYDGP